MVESFDPTTFAGLLREVQATILPCHPLLTPSRLEEYAGTVGTPAFGAFLKSATGEVRDPGRFRDYLRSLVLHGLLLELQRCS